MPNSSGVKSEFKPVPQLSIVDIKGKPSLPVLAGVAAWRVRVLIVSFSLHLPVQALEFAGVVLHPKFEQSGAAGQARISCVARLHRDFQIFDARR